MEKYYQLKKGCRFKSRMKEYLWLVKTKIVLISYQKQKNFFSC